ncbi:TIGR02300 family protein [Alphaproteobacteria bacterium]|nr:TIGR02300 family protein [Alphaproteobacteria bacterium]
MAKIELGLKRTCLSCDMRFYDFKRCPIICPGCGTEFDPENLLKGRKSRVAPKSATKASVSDDVAKLDETEFDAEDVNVAVNKDGDDDDIDFDEDDVDVDVDDTDGPGIIQDDITDGDELLPNLDNKDDQ